MHLLEVLKIEFSKFSYCIFFYSCSTLSLLGIICRLATTLNNNFNAVFFKDPQNLALSCYETTIFKKSSKLPFGSKESLSKILRSCTPESIGFPKTALQRGKFEVPLSELNLSDASPD